MEEREPKIVYAGWIPAKWDEGPRLHALGVYGEMRHRESGIYGDGVFEHCYASGATMMRLILEFKLPNPQSFTAVDAITDQVLPEEYQTHWEDVRFDLMTLV
jgi:hypothetical protein